MSEETKIEILGLFPKLTFLLFFQLLLSLDSCCFMMCVYVPLCICEIQAIVDSLTFCMNKCTLILLPEVHGEQKH